MTYHYAMCGLDYVYLHNGFQRHKTDYGEGVSIARADELDRTIALCVLVSAARLRGQEVRFLRKLAHLSQAALADRIGVKRLTVARWESAPKAMLPGTADRAVRSMVGYMLFGPDVLGKIVELYPETGDMRPPCNLTLIYSPGAEEEPTLFPEDLSGDEKWYERRCPAITA